MPVPKWFKNERPSRQEVLRALKLRSRLSMVLPAAFVILGSLALYPFYVLADMPPNDTLASVSLLLIMALIGVVVWNNVELTRVNERLIKVERRYADFISAQHEAVSRLMGQAELDTNQWDDMRRNMVREIARLLDAERVALWLYDDRHKLLTLELRYERASRQFTTGKTLDGREFPRYFAALERGQNIDAHDAQDDPRLADFSQNGYFAEYDIRSVLDTRLFIDGQLGGILSVEQVGQPRRWTAADIAFAARIGDMVSLAYEARQMRDLRDRLMAARESQS